MQTPWLLLFTTCCIICSEAIRMPPTFKKCSLDDPEFSQCFTLAVADAIGQLTKSFPRAGLQSLDPLEIPSLSVTSPAARIIDVAPHFSNVKIYGYSKLRVDRANLLKDSSKSFQRQQLLIEGFMPEWKLVGNYNMNGTVLLLPIYGDGHCEISFYNSSLAETFFLDEYDRDGEKHWEVTTTDLKFVPESAFFKLDNLYGGDQIANDRIIKILNDNWRALYITGEARFEGVFSAVHKLIANNFFSKVPISEIFL